MAVIVSFVSEKGGVGKTTACFHIAVALQRFHNKRVLVIDADYQRGGITGRFFPQMIETFHTQPPSGETLFNKFQQLYSATQQTPNISIFQHPSGIHVIPSDHRLSTVNTNKLPSTNNIRENNMLLLSHLQTVSLILEPLRHNYDYILIDSHPEISDVLRSIIYASDYCVSPVKLDRQSSIGVVSVVGEIRNVNSDVNMIRMAIGVPQNYRETCFSGAIGMMAREYDEALKRSEQTEYTRLSQTVPMFANYITEGDGLRIAASSRLSVYDVTMENAYKQANQFRALTVEFIQRVP
ncbi:ParA family protein [Aeromonas sp. 61P]|uniref:ParA family protein n=1 Tax=Aeromonas sp. 61P TaxID=3452721 RepID=UPI003F7A13F4